MLTYLAASNPEMTTHEDQHAFVECATFADDLKYHGEGWQSDYHFKDIPNVTEGQASDYDIVDNPRNLTDALNSITAWLSGKQGTDYQTSSIYVHLMDEFAGDENVAKSYALRLLVHYMGDLMQPLHLENLYDSEFPTGDKGGNLFPLQYHYDVDELHALWDKLMYDGYHNIARPFTQQTWDDFQPQVDDVMTNYSYAVKDPASYESVDYDAFGEESYQIALTVYDGVTENEPVPQAYLDKFKPVVYERLNLGGYRLAYTIAYIFSDSAKEQPEVLFLQ